MDLRETGFEVGKSMELGQNRVQWRRTLILAVLKYQIVHSKRIS